MITVLVSHDKELGCIKSRQLQKKFLTFVATDFVRQLLFVDLAYHICFYTKNNSISVMGSFYRHAHAIEAISACCVGGTCGVTVIIEALNILARV